MSGEKKILTSISNTNLMVEFKKLRFFESVTYIADFLQGLDDSDFVIYTHY